MNRDDLHALVDTLPEGALEGAKRILEHLQVWPPPESTNGCGRSGRNRCRGCGVQSAPERWEEGVALPVSTLRPGTVTLDTPIGKAIPPFTVAIIFSKVMRSPLRYVCVSATMVKASDTDSKQKGRR